MIELYVKVYKETNAGSLGFMGIVCGIKWEEKKEKQKRQAGEIPEYSRWDFDPAGGMYSITSLRPDEWHTFQITSP